MLVQRVGLTAFGITLILLYGLKLPFWALADIMMDGGLVFCLKLRRAKGWVYAGLCNLLNNNFV